MKQVKARNVIRGEKHHWWPKSLSKSWLDRNGMVSRIDSKGVVIRSNPKEFGHISDGHNMFFNKESAWNTTIENYFDYPDNAMPQLVNAVENFVEAADPNIGCVENPIQIDILRECLLSLIVRSPMYRSSITNMLENFRGSLDKPETKRLVAANIRQKYHSLVKSSKNAGRLVILCSNDAEFVFGDGFYTTLSSNHESLSHFKAVIPFTPQIAIVWSCPSAYNPNPPIAKMAVTERLVTMVNEATQVYSKDYLFFSNDQPVLIEGFTCNQHMQYVDHEGDVCQFVRELVPEFNLGR
ncbi:DUF4238 domain-containing protein [Vibrio rhodolitus]|uniref:DUF4238 domain-containing protein n=1 Tax=Vibrio rhodolitus TaxID=2231649 RepID=UPI0013E06B89|nr:DUF4238 domain-containing protein [Vibrio rhodolitus]